jgi:ATP synthase protein I
VPALLVTVVLAAGGAIVAGLLGGRPAALGVVAGAVIVAALFSLGMGVTHATAALTPALSLLVALLTYLLQLVLLVVVLTATERSGLVPSTLDRGWLGGTIIVGALVWSVALIRAATRRTALYHDQVAPRHSTDPDEVTGRPDPGTAG